MTLLGRLSRLEKALPPAPPPDPAAGYPADPVAYMREVLHADPWRVQEEIARALLTPPYKCLVKACHGVGKTWLAAALTSWWFDSFRESSAVITTAPTARDVRDLLWTEVRRQRRKAGRGGFRGAQAPELYESEEHYAKGFTAATGESFQGRHFKRMLFVFDEAVGIDAVFWETTKSMFQADGSHGWLVIGNPTDTSSQMYAEDMGGGWHTVTMSAVDHPNLAAQLAGGPAPYPGAVSLEQFTTWLADWCDPIPAEEATALDLEWPPGSGVWFRPGPEMEARGLGRWPSQATHGVWSEALWQAALTPRPFAPAPGTLPQLGCDVARKGHHYTEIHVRWGGTSLHHERHNGWDTVRTATRVAELAREWCARANALLDPAAQKFTKADVPVKVDDDGVGGGVTDDLRAWGYNAQPIGAGTTAAQPELYPRKRSELWFVTAGRAREGRLDLSRLDRATLERLRRQAMAPRWDPDGAGRRVVEKKEKTEERLPGLGSPDGMDALNLAYYQGGDLVGAVGALPEEPGRRKLFGRGQ